MSYVSNNTEAVFNLPEFEFVTKNCAELILTSNSVQVADDLKWEATLRWGRRHCRGQSLDSFRATIKPFLSYINFNRLPVRKLALEVRPLRVLDERVISNAIESQVQLGIVTAVDSRDVVQCGSHNMIGPDTCDVFCLDSTDAIGSSNTTGVMLSEMDTGCEYHSFVNENDFLDELLEEDSDLSAIFDVSMTSA